jgi:hypothetical protein
MKKKFTNPYAILEYNEDQHSWNMNFGDHIENTYGWKTIAKYLHKDHCQDLIDFIKSKYDKHTKLKFDMIFKYSDEYLNQFDILIENAYNYD